ncbi:ammonium transporter AmtB-like domain-containing protein, partial [Phaeosphaeriaceae sp. PMI808]
GAIAWLLISSVLVGFMILGLALFFFGSCQQDQPFKSQMVWLPIMVAAVVGCQWFIYGYATAFAQDPTEQTFWGGWGGVVFNKVNFALVPSKRNQTPTGAYIPELLYALYESMFASFTAALVSGTAINRDRPGHFLIFILFWSTFVYNPIARWTWSPSGWAGGTLGSLDFAGGTAVHLTAGTTVLAHCLYHEHLLERYESFRNLVLMLGTFLMWFGWFGFNGGSALNASNRAITACASTHVAACFGGVIEPSSDMPVFRFKVEDFCNGVIIALVAITPAAGYVPVQVAPVFGSPLVVLPVEWLSRLLSESLGDYHCIFTVHAIGGLFGMILTGFFARGDITALGGGDGTEGRGGWSGHWAQIGYQFADVGAAFGYCLTMTMAILLFLEPLMFLGRGRRKRVKRVARDNDFQVKDKDVFR